MRPLVGTLLAVALALAACGTDERADTSVTIARAAGPAELDPALASGSALEPLWLVYTPLLTYRHAEGERGAELIPGLASDLPEISADRRTYTLHLREGLSYSDDTPVRAGDFERAITRLRGLDSPGTRFYRGITGIEADDETGEITIELARPDPSFADALALPYAAPVPAGTAQRDLTADPPAGVGPYEITGIEPDGSYVLSRSSTFPDLDIPDIPTGNLAEIRVEAGDTPAAAAQDVLDGRLDYMQDRPPAAIAAAAGDRYRTTAAAATAAFSLDLDQAPFDDPLVREAVNRGLDRAALTGAYEGRMQPGCALLAPGVPGYDRDLDTTDCPYGDPAKPPDLTAARVLVEQAGARGARVIVSAGADPEARAVTAAYAAGLSAIGLRPRIERCASCAQTAFGVRSPDFPRPAAFFGFGFVDDPFLSGELDRLGSSTDPNPSADDWGKLDSYVVSPPQSYVAPLGHPTVATFLSERMDPDSAVVQPVYGNDYSSWQLKEGE